MQSYPTKINRKLALQVGFALILIILIYSFYCIFIVNPDFDKVNYDTNFDKIGRVAPAPFGKTFSNNIQYTIEGLYFNFLESTIKGEYKLLNVGLALDNKDTFLMNVDHMQLHSFAWHLSNSSLISQEEYYHYYDNNGHYHFGSNVCDYFLTKDGALSAVRQNRYKHNDALLSFLKEKPTDTLSFTKLHLDALDIQFSLCYSIDYKHYEEFAVPTLTRSYFVNPDYVKRYSDIKVRESGNILDTIYYRDLQTVFLRSSEDITF